MKEAVNHSYTLANKGEVVLLSPACASFDLFDNFEQRGFEFKKAVRSL
jgi:UDP-N-acetylmuramoylalanine--D-glutamate ligase